MSSETIRLLNVRIDNLTMSKALARAEDFVRGGGFHHIVTPGPEFLLEASEHEAFRQILNRADLALPDGMGLHLGARLTGQRLHQRVPGADFVEQLMARAAKHHWKVFLFGGLGSVADEAAQVLVHRHPGLSIVGIESGFRGPWEKLHDQRIVEKIHFAKPDILLVALGAPKQELWIERHRRALHDVKIAIGVGRTLDYIAGRIKRPPNLVRRIGFEWLDTYVRAQRFYQPGARRQRVTNATIRFLATVIRHPHD